MCNQERPHYKCFAAANIILPASVAMILVLVLFSLTIVISRNSGMEDVVTNNFS